MIAEVYRHRSSSCDLQSRSVLDQCSPFRLKAILETDGWRHTDSAFQLNQLNVWSRYKCSHIAIPCDFWAAHSFILFINADILRFEAVFQAIHYYSAIVSGELGKLYEMYPNPCRFAYPRVIYSSTLKPKVRRYRNLPAKYSADFDND